MSKPEDDGYQALKEALEEMRQSPLLRRYFESIESQPYEEYRAWQDSINARLDRLEEAIKERKGILDT